jgi:hypothetical protein
MIKSSSSFVENVALNTKISASAFDHSDNWKLIFVGNLSQSAHTLHGCKLNDTALKRKRDGITACSENNSKITQTVKEYRKLLQTLLTRITLNNS